MAEENLPEIQSDSEGTEPKKSRTFTAWFWFSFCTWYGAVGRMHYFKAWLFLWVIYYIVGIIFAGTMGLEDGKAVGGQWLSGKGAAFPFYFLLQLLLTFLAAKRLQSRYASPYTATVIFIIKTAFLSASIVAAAALPDSKAGPETVGSFISLCFWFYLIYAPPLRDEFTQPEDSPRGLGGALLLLLLSCIISVQEFIKMLWQMKNAFYSAQWQEFALKDGDRYDPILQPLFAGQGILCMLVIIGMLYATYLFLRKRKKFVPVISGMMVMALLVSAYVLLVYCNATFQLDSMKPVAISFVGWHLICCTWIPYIYSAKRVRLTFIS